MNIKHLAQIPITEEFSKILFGRSHVMGDVSISIVQDSSERVKVLWELTSRIGELIEGVSINESGTLVRYSSNNEILPMYRAVQLINFLNERA